MPGVSVSDKIDSRLAQHFLDLHKEGSGLFEYGMADSEAASQVEDEGAEAGLFLSEYQPEEKMSLGLLLLPDRDEA